MSYNKGSGAGGKITSHNGRIFESKTDNKTRLLERGFVRINIPGKTPSKYRHYLENHYQN
jgi:hypothetical protein